MVLTPHFLGRLCVLPLGCPGHYSSESSPNTPPVLLGPPGARSSPEGAAVLEAAGARTCWLGGAAAVKGEIPPGLWWIFSSLSATRFHPRLPLCLGSGGLSCLLERLNVSFLPV